MKVKILINGIRHYVPEEVRDVFYTRIVGQELYVVPEPTNPKNEKAMAAMFEGEMIGHVSESTLHVAWSCFDWKKEKHLMLKVVDVDRVSNSLTVCYNIHHSKINKKRCCNSLSWNWDYDGPILKESEDVFVLNCNTEMLLDDLNDGMKWNRQMECCFEKILENLHLDRSLDMQQRLERIMDRLESKDDQMRANKLQHAITHSNNDEYWEKTWQFIKRNSVSYTFIENVKLWYNKGKVKEIVGRLPEMLRDKFRNPTDIIGFVSYHLLPRKDYMKLLSFVAALDVVDETNRKQNANYYIQGDLNVTGDFLNPNSNKLIN